MNHTPSEELLQGVEELLGARPIAWRRGEGGFSIAERWSLELADGRRVFAKRATTGDIASFLRAEYRNMQAIPTVFRCELIAWKGGRRPILIVEDLSHGRWPPPWELGAVERVREALDRLWSTPPPESLPSAEAAHRKNQILWQKVAEDPSGFLGLGLCSRDWFERCLPTLIEAERAAVFEGNDLLHFDVRSDNLCLLEDRIVLVDWNFACRGPRDLDLALWLPSLRLEGGPLPEEVLSGCGEYAAGFAGYLAERAPLPPPMGAPTVRKFQLRQLRIALPWACRTLGLPEPDAIWAQAECDRADGDLAAGRITEREWHARIEEVLADAYLSYPQPWRQSGKGGDEADWRWARELILDAFPSTGGDFLDIGCANGYLMECLQKWGAERGMRVEPYGVDISWRLASLARRRHPHWADRIYTANALYWTPPRRFDVINFGLEYVAPGRQRAFVNHLVRDVLAPGGRLVVRPWRVNRAEGDPAEQLAALGFRPDGILEARHPVNGELRRTVWLGAR